MIGHSASGGVVKMIRNLTPNPFPNGKGDKNEGLLELGEGQDFGRVGGGVNFGLGYLRTSSVMDSLRD